MRRPSPTVGRLVVLLASVALVGSACGAEGTEPQSSGAGGGASSPGSGTGVATASATPPAPTQLALPDDVGQAVLDATRAEEIASATITPLDGGAVTARTADGIAWSLRVPPLALAKPATITLHRLTGATDLGPIVAGVSFEPAGLSFAIPATLTIRGAAIPTSLAAFDYHGPGDAGVATLDIMPRPTEDTITLLVSHFSGSVAVDVGADANTLYEKWMTSRGDDTAAGRQAAAETRYASAELAANEGRISEDTASSIKTSAAEDWMAAERDRLLEDPALTSLVKGGKVEDFERLSEELGKVATFNEQLGQTDGKADGLRNVMSVASDYLDALLANVAADPKIKAMIDGGRTSDLATLSELTQVILGLERQFALLGSERSEGLPAIADMMIRYRGALLAQCGTIPIDPQLALGLERQAALLGFTDSGDRTLLECLLEEAPATRPPDPVVITGQITWTATATYEKLPDNVVEVVLDAVIKPSTDTLQLVFARGSRIQVDWSGFVVYDNCPSSHSFSGTVGSAGPNGADSASDTNPDVLASVSTGAGGDLRIELLLPTEMLSGGCGFPGFPMICPQDEGVLVGKLVGTTPREYSFACAEGGDDFFISSGGRLVGG